MPALLGHRDPGAAFTAVLQLGTLVAVVVYFARDLLRMARAVVLDRRSPDARLAVTVVAGTIPIGVAGIVFKRFIVGDARSLWVVATALIVVAVILWVVDRRARHARGLEQLGLLDALLIGVAQACALIPGVSRSGATIAAALGLGFRREDAARFSFLLSIPAIAAAGLFELPEALRGLSGRAVPPLVVGTVAAGVVGYASIAALLWFVRSRTFLPMVVYRIALGLTVIGLLLAHVLSPLE